MDKWKNESDVYDDIRVIRSYGRTFIPRPVVDEICEKIRLSDRTLVNDFFKQTKNLGLYLKPSVESMFKKAANERYSNYLEYLAHQLTKLTDDEIDEVLKKCRENKNREIEKASPKQLMKDQITWNI